MKFKNVFAITLLGYAFSAVTASAATGSFTGLYSTNFDGLGTGTAMPLGYRTMVTGSGNNTYNATTPISAAGIAAATASGTQTLTVWTPPAAAASSSTALFNCGTPGNTADRALGSDVTSVAAVVIELSLSNNTGSNLPGVIFNYDSKCMTNGNMGTEASELPGYAFFYSITGGTSASEWTRVDALCLSNYTQGTSSNSGNVTITFLAPLTNNGRMFFRWADDNNVASSPDQMIAIDNVSITASTNTPPTVALTSPSGPLTVAMGTNLTLSATASDSGTVTKVEFFQGGNKIGEVVAEPYSFEWTNVSTLGNGLITARATDNDGATAVSAGIILTVVPDFGTGGIYFDGVNDYATFGQAPALGVSNFTLECWFKRTGTGATTTTGTGGVTAYPLVTKGRGENDNGATNCNFFLGITTTGRLAADFEDFNNGLNHPITGAGTISSNTWQHAAVTYNASSGTWMLYLNGVPDATNVISGTALVRLPRHDSLQHAALATALNTTGATEGFFSGKLDEVRVWNYARSGAEIFGSFLQQIESAEGLVGRWALDETNGVSVTNTGSSGVNGTLVNGPLFVSGFPFDNPPQFLVPPDQPVLIAPADNETGLTNYPVLSVGVSDLNTNALTVTFYGRAATVSTNPDFTVVALPDTQFYSQSHPDIFAAQTDWIVSNRAALNIVYVPQLGDCVQNGDNGGNDIEWRNATNAMYRLENPLTTLLPHGIPYGIAVGNHDQGPNGNGDPLGTTTFYNQYFGTNHFLPYDYYGGNFGANNDNHYDTFSAGGLDFIVIYFEYDTTATDTNAALYAWARNLLQTHPNHRGIIVSHWIMNSGTGGTFGAQGQGIYDALKGCTNLSLMLCGHINPGGEGRRSDTFNGRTVWTLLSDYQDFANGGNGWLRTYTFSPADNVIRAKTYSPTLDQYRTNAESQFEIPFDMTPQAPFQVIGSVSNVPSGSNAGLIWPGLAKETAYDWYVTVSDGTFTTTGPVWRFTTGTNAAPVPPVVAITNPPNGATFVIGADVTLGAVATDIDGIVTNVALYQGATLLTNFDSAPYNFTVSGLGLGSYAFHAIATDDTGLSTTSSVVNITITPESVYVIHISVDGLRPDAIVNLGSANLPNFFRLREQGAFTDNARTDYDYSITLPNHTAQLTGRGVTGPTGHNWTDNDDPAPGETLAANKGSYIAGAFDVAHDNGLRTAEYASKTKFSLYNTSWDATNGAPDLTGPDNGCDKIDVYLNLSDTSQLVDNLVAQMAAQPCHYVFLHFADPDNAGHANGWNITPGSAYCNAIMAVDTQLGKIFSLLDTNTALHGRTAILLSADHGGTGTGHSDASVREHYTIPFYAWGHGVATNAELYSLNAATRLDPGTGRPTYAAASQPIRNGDMANAALKLLGLDPVPGSTINSNQNLILTVAPVNNSPVAQDAAFARGAGLPLAINITNLLTSYTSDPDSDPRSLISLGTSSQGATIVTNSTNIIYTPANDNADNFTYTIADIYGAQATAAVNVMVVSPGGIAQGINASTGGLNIQFAGIPGYEYDVLRSTNLVDWEIMTNVIAPLGGVFPFTDTNAPSPAFYRLMQH